MALVLTSCLPTPFVVAQEKWNPRILVLRKCLEIVWVGPPYFIFDAQKSYYLQGHMASLG